jgi:hypothetical protein
MTQYLEHGFTLTDKQLKQIADAAKKERSVKVKLEHAQLVGEHKLLITKTQENHITKNYNTGIGVVIELSAKQLKKTVSGGVLPLLALLPLIFGGLGAAGGVAGGVASAVQAANAKKAEEARQRELERHNKEIEAQVQGTGLVTVSPSKGKGKSKGKASTAQQQGGCGESVCPTCKGTGLYLLTQ